MKGGKLISYSKLISNMQTIEKWEEIINSISENSTHAFNGWLIDIKKGIKTFSKYEELRVYWEKFNPTLTKNEKECLSEIWNAQKKYYFDEYYIIEIKQDFNHPLQSYVLMLEREINNFNQFKEYENMWDEFITYTKTISSYTTSSLIRGTISKAYTSVKYKYFKDVLVTEIFEERTFPVYAVTNLLIQTDNPNDNDFLFLEKHWGIVESFLHSQGEQFQKAADTIITDAWRNWMTVFFKTKGAVTGWEVITAYINSNLNWTHYHELLTITNKKTVSQEDLNLFDEKIENEIDIRKTEVNSFQFKWFEHELQKKRRRLSRKLEVQTDEHYGHWIRELRKEKKMSLKDVHLLTGFSISFIQRIELGQRNLRLPVAEKIGKALGATTEEIWECLGNEIAKDSHSSDIITWIKHNQVRIKNKVLTPKNQEKLIDLLEMIVSEDWNENQEHYITEITKTANEIR